MKFCVQCNNMLYTVVEAGEGAFNQCRKCPYKEPITAENPLVYEHLLKEDTTAKLVKNKYLKEDTTLLRFSSIICPNADCPTKKGVVSDVVAVKVDPVNVVWMYQCAVCDWSWKQSARGS